MELHVVDDGEGFPEGLLARAFERFSQADRARSGEGAGLGLAIVAAIATPTAALSAPATCPAPEPTCGWRCPPPSRPGGDRPQRDQIVVVLTDDGYRFGPTQTDVPRDPSDL